MGKLIFICCICNQSFSRYASQCISPKGSSKYCSKPCADSSRRGISSPKMGVYSKKEWVKKECITCNKEFEVTPCRRNQAQYCSLKCRKIWNKGLNKDVDDRLNAGDKHYNWRGGVTKYNDYQRKLFKKQMQKLIFERDNYTCQLCEAKGDLQVDHIQSWAGYIELRFTMDNCRTLCKSCHYKITYKREIPDKTMPWGHTRQKGRI